MEETTATTETQPFLGEDWFDPLETAVGSGTAIARLAWR